MRGCHRGTRNLSVTQVTRLACNAFCEALGQDIDAWSGDIRLEHIAHTGTAAAEGSQHIRGIAGLEGNRIQGSF